MKIDPLTVADAAKRLSPGARLALDSMARERELLRQADERNAEVQRLLDAARDAIDHDFDRHTRQ